MHNATLTGSPTFTTAATGFGQALTLNGSSQYASLAGQPLTFSSGASFTIRARFKTSSASGVTNIVGHYSSAGANTDIYLGLSSGAIIAQVNGFNGNANWTGGSGFADGAWHTLKLQVTGSTAQLFVDGSAVGSAQSGAYAPLGGTYTDLIGAWWNGGTPNGFFNGSIDEVAVYNVSTGAANPAAPTSNTDSGIVALYHCDSGNVSGTTMLDCAGATFSVSPTTGATGASLTFTGTLTQWTTVAPAFTITGAGNSIGSQSVSTATAATGTLTGATTGAQTITDASNGATASFTVTGGGPTPGTLSHSSLASTTATLSIATDSGGTAPYSNQLQWSANGSTGWTNLTGGTTPATASTNPATGTTASWNVTGMTPGTQQYFRVVVTDNASASANSNTDNFATPASPSLTLSLARPFGATGVASQTITVTASVAPGTNVSVTLSDGGAGTFSPSSPTILSGQTTATFTYTPPSTGLKTITASATSYVPGTLQYASLTSSFGYHPVAAPYGAAYPGQASALGYTVFDAVGTLVIPHTTGLTGECGTNTGLYAAKFPADPGAIGVVVMDAPSGAPPFEQAFDLTGTTTTETTYTATAGGTATITLQAGQSYGTNLLRGRVITVTGGTGAGQSEIIASNTNASPSVVTIARNWGTQPSTDSTYTIGDAAGVDWSNVNAPTSTVNLSGTTVGTVTANSDKTGYSLAAGSIAAATFAAGAVDATAFAQGAADKVWSTATRALTDKANFTLSSAYDAAKTAAQVGDAMALTSGERSTLSGALLDLAAGVETSLTLRQALRLIVAASAGKVSGAGTTTIVIRNTTDSKNRITATCDSSGNRTAITTDLT